MKWIEIIELPCLPARKTKMFKVLTPHAELGRIEFYVKWWKYVFYPTANTLYEEDCLRDIAEFCANQTAEWRKKSQASRKLSASA